MGLGRSGDQPLEFRQAAIEEGNRRGSILSAATAVRSSSALAKRFSTCIPVDSELLDRVAGSDGSCQPTWSLSATRPGLGGRRWILIFGQNDGICATELISILRRHFSRESARIPVEVCQPLLQFVHFGGNSRGKYSAGLFVQVPERIDRHSFQFKLFHRSPINPS